MFLISLLETFSHANPIAKAELASMERQPPSRLMQALDRLLFVVALAAAVLPFIFYVRYDLNPFVLNWLVLLALCIWIELRIVSSAVNCVETAKQSPAWEALVLTGVSPQRYVLGKWWAVVRYHWRWYLGLAGLRLALAWGIMQYLNIYPVWIDESMNSFTRPFIYMSFAGFRATQPMAYYPNNWHVLTASVVLWGFSVLEAGLLAAIGVVAGLLLRRFYALAMGLAVALRIGITLLTIFLLPLIENGVWVLGVQEPMVYWGRCDRFSVDYQNWCLLERDKRRVAETLQTAVTPLADTGIVLSANILRPIAGLTFVVRNLMSAILSAGFYLAVIALVLKAAQRAAIRRGIAPP